jgi:hypothetical protein
MYKIHWGNTALYNIVDEKGSTFVMNGVMIMQKLGCSSQYFYVDL